MKKKRYLLVIFHECPELLQPVQLPRLAVLQCLGLEVSVEVRAELLLEAVTVKSEQALQAISRNKTFSEDK